MSQPFSLRFMVNQIADLASHYDLGDKERDIIGVIVPRVQTMGYCDRDDFLALCEWKSPRPRKHYQNNAADFIRAVTEVALSSPDERLRIEVLTLLDGVLWPTASVLLHFAHRDPYPILDFRALWSLGVDEPPVLYNFDFWQAYTQYCRELAQKAGVSMRILDRALWQYSKENQSP